MAQIPASERLRHHLVRHPVMPSPTNHPCGRESFLHQTRRQNRSRLPEPCRLSACSNRTSGSSDSHWDNHHPSQPEERPTETEFLTCPPACWCSSWLGSATIESADRFRRRRSSPQPHRLSCPYLYPCRQPPCFYLRRQPSCPSPFPSRQAYPCLCLSPDPASSPLSASLHRSPAPAETFHLYSTPRHKHCASHGARRWSCPARPASAPYSSKP